MKQYLHEDVFTAAINRIKSIYLAGHRPVLSISGGKDSGVLLELLLIAAKETGNLPVECVIQDEEVAFPGTYEYVERQHNRPGVLLHWIVAHQPMINIFNRECPYFWVFDPLLKPSEWVRQPPNYVETITDINIEHTADAARFPPQPGKKLVHIIGLRVQESRKRAWAIASAKGFMTAGGHKGYKSVNAPPNECQGYPIYDWKDGDIWKAILENHWDYNHIYDVMNRLGLPRSKLRVGPPSMTVAALDALRVVAKAYPQWFEKVCQRLPGVRAAVRFGRKVLLPTRKLNESWEQCFQRTCIDEAPKWIADRAEILRRVIVKQHASHSTAPLPQVEICKTCTKPGSWRHLAQGMYMGDPFSMFGTNSKRLYFVEPEIFRKGAGCWGGKPHW